MKRKNLTPLPASDARWGTKVYIVPSRMDVPGHSSRVGMQRGIVMDYQQRHGALVAWAVDGGVEADWFDLADLTPV